MKVYVRTGDLKFVADREKFPSSEEELITLFKEAVNSDGRDDIGLGTLTRISAKGRSGHSLWIATKSLVQKAGFKIEKEAS